MGDSFIFLGKYSSYSKVTRSVSTLRFKNTDADSLNFSGDSVVGKRQVPPFVHLSSISV